LGPGPVAEQGQPGRQQHAADDGRVDEHRDRHGHAEHLELDQ
jgi:hypothetical protein